jgi:hypothetical protein
MPNAFDAFMKKKAVRYVQLTKYNDWLFLGGYADAADGALLRQHGITAIVNLSCEVIPIADEQPNEFKRCIMHCPDGEPVSPRNWQRFIDTMDTWWDGDEVILVHCGAGLSRTPSFVLGWWISRIISPDRLDLLPDTWSCCEQNMRVLRPEICPHNAIKRSFFAYMGYEYHWPDA